MVQSFQIKTLEIQLIESCKQLIGVSYLFQINYITSIETGLQKKVIVEVNLESVTVNLSKSQS